MGVYDWLERRFRWLAFPGFLRYYALLHVLVFVVQMFRPDIGELLDFDRSKIFGGEVWRIFTCFFATSQFGAPTMLNIVFLFFAVNFAFMINDGLEGGWGEFRTSLFCYAGMLGILVANFLLPGVPAMSGFALYGSAFLAFATMYPRFEILLLFFIPVQVRLLAIVQAVSMALMVFSAPWMLPFFLLAFANYLVGVGIPALRGSLLDAGARNRRRRMEAMHDGEQEAFHACEVCRRTDQSHPALEFRVGQDGREYCEDHLPGRESTAGGGPPGNP